MKKILLTGGLGYIGSHVAVELAEKGYEIIIIDDLSNSELFVLDRIREITEKNIAFAEGDLRDVEFLNRVFTYHSIDGIIHLAAKKAVGESVRKPLLYYDVNVGGLITLLKTIERFPIRKFIFSSSCTVYGAPDQLPVTEQTPFGETPSPYGKTKQMCEGILKGLSDVCDFDTVSLRYFNPVGAHHSAMIGELPKGPPNNLVPFITQTSAGIRSELSVFGSDYHTPDGSAVRDYIHVVDLAKAHVRALEVETGKYEAFNIGTGEGYSVLDVLRTFQEVNKIEVRHKIVARREGDVEAIYGDPHKANQILNWKAELGLSDMMKDAWRWQQSLS